MQHIYNTNFEDVQGSIAGAIYKNGHSHSVYLEHSTFTLCRGGESGGLYTDSPTTIISSYFISCNGNMSGAVSVCFKNFHF